MDNYDHILKKAANYVVKLLSIALPGSMYFHNLRHTLEVVDAVEEIGKKEGLKDSELEPLKIAAWFHDTGYCYQYQGHEDVSIKLANDFLISQNYCIEKTIIIISCIQATKYPQRPATIEEQIICDADLYHFSCSDYDLHEQNLRKEWLVYLNKKYSDIEWSLSNCDMLHNHTYFTKYGQTFLQMRKLKNIDKMRCRFNSL